MIWRNFFYSLVIVGGLLVAEIELRAGHFTGFWVANVVVIVALLLEILTAALNSHAALRSRDSLLNFDDYTRAGQLINHILIPISLYTSAAGFLYFFGNTWVGIVTLISLSLIYTLLFTHLTAYFAKLQELIKQTHQAYDVAKLAIVFFASGFFWQIGASTGRMSTAIICILLIMLGSLLLTLLRYREWHSKALLISLGITLLLLVGLITMSSLGLSGLQVSLITSLVYYALIAALQHYFDADLNLAIVLEYSLVISLITIVIIGLNS